MLDSKKSSDWKIHEKVVNENNIDRVDYYRTMNVVLNDLKELLENNPTESVLKSQLEQYVNEHDTLKDFMDNFMDKAYPRKPYTPYGL